MEKSSYNIPNNRIFMIEARLKRVPVLQQATQAAKGLAAEELHSLPGGVVSGLSENIRRTVVRKRTESCHSFRGNRAIFRKL